MPNSSMLVFPAINMPAASSFSTTVAAKGLWNPCNMLEAHVVGSSVVHMLSLIAIERRESLFRGFESGESAGPWEMLPILAGSRVETHAFSRADNAP